MRSISIFLIFCHVNVVAATAFASWQDKIPDMKVTLVKNNSIIANKGSNHGINVGLKFDIHSRGIIIGRAEVRVVRETLCGLIIQSMNPNYAPSIGDKLKLIGQPPSEQRNILEELEATEFSPDKLTKREVTEVKSL